jgi:hypothetical protein
MWSLAHYRNNFRFLTLVYFYKMENSFRKQTFVFKYPYDVFSVESHSDASYNRTVQIIRAQVQKQVSKRSNFQTWAHIIPVANQNHEGFQTNSITTKITQFNITHRTYISQIVWKKLTTHQSHKYYKPDSKSSESISYTHIVQIRLPVL